MFRGIIVSEKVEESANVDHPLARPPALSLWALCVVIGAVLISAWAGDRAKPLVLFPLVIGAAFGGWAGLVGIWADVPRRWWAVLLVMLGAVALVPAIFAVAASRQSPAVKPANPLAEKLLKQFEQQDQSAEPMAPPRLRTYLDERYPRTDLATLLACLGGECLLAGAAAGMVMMWAWRGRSEKAEETQG